MRSSIAGLGIVLAVAAVLRFWAIGHGLPIATGVDEPQIMTRVMRMMTTGDFNPHFFDYPGLYLYVQLAVACVRFLFGVFNGEWASLAQVNANDFYLWGRAITAILGTATVYLVYLIGSRWGARYALLAAGLMAVMPSHVRESHYILTDVPMTFFAALSFLLTLRALEKRTLAAFAWAGAVAGLAAATKYYGGVVLVVPLFAAGVVSGIDRSRTVIALAVLGAAAGAFLIGAPYTVLDLPGFLNGFATLATAFNGGAPAEPAWLTYFKHVRNAIWWPGILLLTWGTIHAVVRAITGPGKDRFALLVLFPVLYFALVGTRTLVLARYLMPMFPFISVLIAVAIVSGVTLLRRFNIPRTARTALIVALTVVAILPPAVNAIGFDAMISRRATNDLAYDWIVRNLPARSRVLIDIPGFGLPASRYETVTLVHRAEASEFACAARDIHYFLASREVFGRYMEAPARYPAEFGIYSRLFQGATLAAVFNPSSSTPGAQIRIYKCPPSTDLQTLPSNGTQDARPRK